MCGRRGQDYRQRRPGHCLSLLCRSMAQGQARSGGLLLLLLLLLLRRLFLLLLRCDGRKLLAHSIHSWAQRARRARRAGRRVWNAAGAAPSGLLRPHGRQALHHAHFGSRLGQWQAHQLQGSRLSCGEGQVACSSCRNEARQPAIVPLLRVKPHPSLAACCQTAPAPTTTASVLPTPTPAGG